MTRTFSAMALSLTLILTSLTATAAPARADEDVAKILAGLALLGIIASVARDNNEPAVTRPHRPHRPVVTPRPAPVRKVAPRRCLREQWTHRGTRLVYGARCLQNRAAVNPPHACLRDARTNSGPRRFYTKRCLRKHGWRA